MKENVTILIVDDDAEDIELFIDAVKELNASIRCTSAMSGKEALLLLANSQDSLPDFIFLDLNMPGMNGKTCLSYINNDPRFSSIPVIIYTTSKLVEDAVETRLFGAAAFITKPVKLDDLKIAISTVLNSLEIN